MADRDKTYGIELPQLGMGCWSFAGGQYWGNQSVDDSIRTVHAALDHGVTLFDTSENYADDHHSEEVLGIALAGRREEALIATKVATGNLRKDDVIAACQASLERLSTDYIDLYQIHWPNRDVPIAETCDAITHLLERGLIRSFGVCNFGPIDLDELLGVRRPVSNQMPYNLLWRGVEQEVVPTLEEEDIGLMCYSPLAQGLLAGRYMSADEVTGGLKSSRVLSADLEPEGHDIPGLAESVFSAVRLVIQLSSELGVPAAGLAAQWLLSQPMVRTVLVGARRPEEIVSMVQAVGSGGAELATALGKLSDGTADLKAMRTNNLDMWTVPGRMR